MTLTLRERLPNLRAHLAVRARDGAAIDSWGEPLAIVGFAGRWTVFDSEDSDAEWLGDIVEEGDVFRASHECDPGGYRFPDFQQAVAYFREYSTALKL